MWLVQVTPVLSCLDGANVSFSNPCPSNVSRSIKFHMYIWWTVVLVVFVVKPQKIHYSWSSFFSALQLKYAWDDLKCLESMRALYAKDLNRTSVNLTIDVRFGCVVLCSEESSAVMQLKFFLLVIQLYLYFFRCKCDLCYKWPATLYSARTMLLVYAGM